MRVFAVTGYSGTGKTTLVESIIRALVNDGYSVATIKSSKHQAGLEEGSDTWKHMRAGASLAIFMGPSTELISFKKRLSAAELVELSKQDFLIVEGMKSSNLPKFWCLGSSEILHDEIPQNTWAIVSWTEEAALPGLDLPVIISDELEKLVEIVKKRAVDFYEIE